MNDYLKDDFIDEVKGCLGKEGDGSGLANVIESIKVNGVDQSVDSNKSVDIPVPTKTSDLDNDSGYMTEDQVNNKVTEGVASIVADAPEDFDTLKEMSDWLTKHDESAAAMNTSIKKNSDDITALQTSKADQEDVNAVLEDVGEINSNLEALEDGIFYDILQTNMLEVGQWWGDGKDIQGFVRCKKEYQLECGKKYKISVSQNARYPLILMPYRLDGGDYYIDLRTQVNVGETRIIEAPEGLSYRYYAGDNNVQFTLEDLK